MPRRFFRRRKNPEREKLEKFLRKSGVLRDLRRAKVYTRYIFSDEVPAPRRVAKLSAKHILEDELRRFLKELSTGKGIPIPKLSKEGRKHIKEVMIAYASVFDSHEKRVAFFKMLKMVAEAELNAKRKELRTMQIVTPIEKALCAQTANILEEIVNTCDRILSKYAK